MRCHLWLVATAVLWVAGSSQATELDRARELERAQQSQRTNYELAFARLAEAEPQRLEAEHGQVIRTGGELALSLTRGRWTYFHDDEVWCLSGVIPARTDGCVRFFFVGHPVPQYYLLRAPYPEGSDYRLVDRETGHQTNVPAEPHFASDGSHFVTVSAAEIYDPDGIEVWSLASGSPKLQWSHVPSQFALYHFVAWDGDRAVSLKVETYVDHVLRKLPARLLLGDTGWMLPGPVEASPY